MLQFVDESRAKAASAASGAPGRNRSVASSASAVSQPTLAGVLPDLIRRAAGAAAPGVDLDLLCAGLATAGATEPLDFAGLDTENARIIWEPFAACRLDFLSRFLQLCDNHTPLVPRAQTQEASSAASGPAPPEAMPAQPNSPASATTPVYSSERGLAALALVAQARRQQTPLEPRVLASALRDMARLPDHPLGAQDAAPRAAAKRARATAAPGDSFEVQATWLEFSGWKRSASQYASAVHLWGEAASLAGERPWPPAHASTCAFSSLFRSSASLGRYFSHIRSVLALLRVPAGELADTARLVRGAEKAGADQVRPRVWASAAQTRGLAGWAIGARRRDLALSFVVSRHFCLRYASETLSLGSTTAPFRFLRNGTEAVLTFTRRKCYRTPVDVTRKCICADSRNILCGVCALREAAQSSAMPFAHIAYAEALAFLKAGANALALPQAQHWGTHAFRRGFANDALRAGGPSALFWSGGWRGVAAFGYATAQARGDFAAAQWLTEHSESSGDED